jgi:hypothetical protein
LLSIITCLRSQAVSSHWAYHVWLLQRTLDSFLAQSNSSFRVGVVCHEVPDIPQLRHPKVSALPVAFAPPARNNDEMCADKVLKLTVGVEWALQGRSDYVMFVDGDDLASRRIADFVSQHKGEHGWYSDSVYCYRYGGHVVRRHNEPPDSSGPTVVVRTDALRFSDPADSSEFWHKSVSARGNGNARYLQALAARGSSVSTLAAIGHNDYVALLDATGFSVRPFPFVANMYILHPDSTSNVPGGEGSAVLVDPPKRSLVRRTASRAKQVARALPTMHILTSGMRREFSVVAGSDLPPAFRTRGFPL